MKLSVVGLGKLGLPLAVLLAEHYEVIGVDTDQTKINKISKGICPIDEPAVPRLMLTSNLKVSTEYERVDVTFIVVPTPS